MMIDVRFSSKKEYFGLPYHITSVNRRKIKPFSYIEKEFNIIGKQINLEEKYGRYLVRAHLFVKVSRSEDGEGTFSVIKSSCQRSNILSDKLFLGVLLIMPEP